MMSYFTRKTSDGLLGGWTVVLLFLSLVTAAHSGNLLTNPSFDPDLSSWQTRIEGGCDATAELLRAPAPHGLRFAHLVSRSAMQPSRFIMLITNPSVRSGKRYTLSAYVRTVRCGYAWIGGGPDWGLRQRLPEDTEGKWVRVSASFDAKDSGVWPVMILVEHVTESLDVDAVQLEEGDKVTEFEGPQANVRLVPARFGSLFFPGDKARFTLEIENYAEEKRSFGYEWRCRSLGGDGKGTVQRPFPTVRGRREVPPQKVASVSITPKGADPLGVYSLEVKVRDESGREFRPDGRFGRIQPPLEKGYDRLGINIHVGTDAGAQLVRLLGLGWVRIDWNWNIFEQSGPGKIDFATMESWFTPVEKLGIKALPNLCYAPDWAKTADGLFDRQAHALYVRRVLEHFKGRIEAFNVWNEPEGMIRTPEDCDFWAEVVRGVYDVAKQVAPEVKVVGLAMGANQGDSSGEVGRFLMPPRSIGRWLDAWDWHTYPAPRNRAPELPDRVNAMSVDGMKESLPGIREMVKGREVWTSEYGHSTCDPNDPQTRASAANTPILAPWHVTEEQQANYLCRQTILMLGYGMDRAFIYQLGPDGEGGFIEEQCGVTRMRNGVISPKVSFVQLAALVRFLSTAKFTGVEIPEPNVRVVNLTTPGGPAKIAWAVQGEAKLAVSFGPKGQVADRFGNARPCKGGISVRLTEAPVYLTGLR